MEGPKKKKRNYFSPRTVWDREDWNREVAKPASEGGMNCVELDWETNYSNYVRHELVTDRKSRPATTTTSHAKHCHETTK